MGVSLDIVSNKQGFFKYEMNECEMSFFNKCILVYVALNSLTEGFLGASIYGFIKRIRQAQS